MGLRKPRAAEAAQLRRHLRAQLGLGLAIRPEHYLEAGRGAFGRFEETFRLPRDVDVNAITASHERGILRIHMPRRPRMSPPRTGKRFGGAPWDLDASMTPRWPLAAAYPRF